LTPDYKKVVASGRTLKEISGKVVGDDVILISASKNYRGFVTAA